MKKFRVYDTVNNEYLVSSEDLFICATGKIYQRIEDGTLKEVTNCVVEWQSEFSAEAGFTICEGDVICASYINGANVIAVVQKDTAKVIYANREPPTNSDKQVIRTIHLKGNIHFDTEYNLLRTAMSGQ